MPVVLSVAEVHPPNKIKQNDIMEFSRGQFSEAFKDIERLLKVFQNGEIQNRYFVKDMSWYEEEKSFSERNSTYIQSAVELGSEAIQKCLSDSSFLSRPIQCSEVDAIIFISSTGISTPSIEARIMNSLPFSIHTKRIPIWGLGCAGGAAGLSRAYEYCKAYPESLVLVLAVEFCSLTFQLNDLSKSNLIGTSLFSDGVACALLAGDQFNRTEVGAISSIPEIIATQSTTLKNSTDIMGWEVKDEGLFVVFSRSIPSLVKRELKPTVEEFLTQHHLDISSIDHFIAHPGGKKVLDAYVLALGLTYDHISVAQDVLRNYGNMSSVTILYVLRQFMNKGKRGDLGLATALGPGFSSELLLMRWSK